MRSSFRNIRLVLAWSALMLLVFGLALPAPGQRITGSIAGTVTDTTGAVLASARVTLTDPSHGLKREVKANEMGKFEFPDLSPGVYRVEIEAPGFTPHVEIATVRVGLATPIEARLKVGATTTEVTIQGATENIDPIRSTVQGIVSGNMIDSLPLNGRNFLDLAQQQPGVQVVDGGSFDPTKNGMAGVSVGGRTGRVTRIQVDGVDITDETVGTTVANISNEAIQEFNIAQSNLDPSTDMTSSGAVNVITRSGSNGIHGSGFGLFRDSSFAADQRVDKSDPLTGAATSPKPPYDRKLLGGRVGGPFIKDKWFWHVEYERNIQHRQEYTVTPLFPQYNGAHPVPFNERMVGARTDFNLTNNIKAFYRFSHNWNNGVTGFGGKDLQAYTNLNNTNIHVAGVDYASGRFTHQARFSYVNFNNFIKGANDQAGTPLTIDPSGIPVQFYLSGQIYLGPDYLAPQATFQDNKQVKYDGSFLRGRHTFRFGGEVNHIVDGLYAAFFSSGPRTYSTTTAQRSAFGQAAYTLFNPSGGATDVLNWPLTQVRVANGLGFFSEIPTHNQPFGGLINTRFGFYGQDTIQVTRNLNLNFGLRWTMNTNLDNNDLPRASTVKDFDPRLAPNPVRPYTDFGPSAGFAWNVRGDGKTVVRGGAGMYYETNIINSFMFDRKTNVPPGFGASYPTLSSSTPTIYDPVTKLPLFNFTTDCVNVLPGINNCFNTSPYVPIGFALPFITRADALYKAAYAAAAAAYPLPGVAASFDQNRGTLGGDQLVYPQYKTPYGIQANIGFQRELKKGLVLTADYVRNHGVHFNSQINWNRNGAANTLDVAVAQDAILRTLAAKGVPAPATGPGTPAWFSAINSCTTCKFSNFVSLGIGSGTGVDTSTSRPYGYAFGGNNRNFRAVNVIMPVGLSTFQALQLALRGDFGGWGNVIKKVQTNLTYQLGRFETTNADQDFNSSAAYNDRPTKFYGPYNQDRTHQFGFTFMFDMPWGINFSTTSALRSRRASSLFLPGSSGADEIFFSDIDGDGVYQDPVPGTSRGAFGRSVNAGNINDLISKYNSQYAGQLLPAAVALVNAGLFTSDQLKALGATAVALDSALPGQVDNPWFFNSDLRLSKTIHITEHVNLVPMMEIFNVFNHSNYGALSETLDSLGTHDPSNPLEQWGSANGTNSLLLNGDRVGFGSGSFSPGTQRAFQFGFRVNW